MNFNPLLITTTIALDSLENDVLAAANIALNGFGFIGSTNKAFKPMKELALIDANGKPADSHLLLQTLDFVINKRVDEGTFV